MQCHSFKVRGAQSKMAQMTEEERAPGVICSSAGNHAQGVALVARTLVRCSSRCPPFLAPSLTLSPVTVPARRLHALWTSASAGRLSRRSTLFQGSFV